MTRKADFCPHCGAPNPEPAYRGLRYGIPSVTQVCGLLDTGRSGGMGWAAALIAGGFAIHDTDQWAHLSTANCTRDKDGMCEACRLVRRQHDIAWKAKAALGTHVHHLALSWAHGETVEADDASAPYLDALESFYVTHNPKWLLTEQTVWYGADGREYRGTLDGICDIDCPVCEDKRCTFCVDFKKCSLHPAEQSLQLAALRYAEQVTEWIDGAQHLVGPVPAVEHTAVILLQSDGEFRLELLPGDEDAFDIFLHLREAWAWNRKVEKGVA